MIFLDYDSYSLTAVSLETIIFFISLFKIINKYLLTPLLSIMAKR
jgi:hypothetical protein